MIAGVLAVAWLTAGCNVGMTPSGGSDAQVKAAYDAMPIDERAKVQMASPAPLEQKLKRIQDMYAKEGKPVPAQYQSGAAVQLPPGAAHN